MARGRARHCACAHVRQCRLLHPDGPLSTCAPLRPLLHPTTAQPPTHRSTVPSDRFQGQYAANKMTEVGATRVVVAYEDASYGQSLAFAFVAGFTKNGGTAYMLPVPRGEKDAAAVVAELRRTGANGLFIASNNVPWMGGASLGAAAVAARLRRGRAAAGWSSVTRPAEQHTSVHVCRPRSCPCRMP